MDVPLFVSIPILLLGIGLIAFALFRGRGGSE